MAVYDLEEQDQLEDVKAWWAQWGNHITLVVTAVCVAIVGVQGWRWWQHSQAEQASVLYTSVSMGVRTNDMAKAKDAMAQLTNKYSGTSYAPRAGMILARMLFDSGDKAGAKAQLQWVVDKSGEDELRQIARYRLAEVQFDEKQYDDALRTLDAKHDDAFAGLYADLRGDVLAGTKRIDEARAAYQTALSKVDTKSAYRNYIEVKLNAIGGPLPASAAAPATGTTPPAAATAPATATPPATATAPAPATTPPATSTAPAPATPPPATATAPAPAPSAPTAGATPPSK